MTLMMSQQRVVVLFVVLFVVAVIVVVIVIVVVLAHVSRILTTINL